MEGSHGDIPAIDPEYEELKVISARFHDTYIAFFGDNPDADWVMIGDNTGEIYGSGTDKQIASDSAYLEMESVLGERVHLFGRPVDIGLDGANPFPDTAYFTLPAGTELPTEIVEYLESNNIPYRLIPTDEPQPVRLLTGNGIFEGSSILKILGSKEFQPEAQ